MIRKTALGLAAAATLALAMGASPSTASAGANVHFSFGVPVYGYGYNHGYHAPHGQFEPVYGYYTCRNVIVGYKKVLTHKGPKKKPIYRRHCGY